MFSREFCEISKNSFFGRTPPVADSENLSQLKMFFGKKNSAEGVDLSSYSYVLSKQLLRQI